MDHFKEEEEGRLILPLGQEAAALPWLLDPSPLLLLLLASALLFTSSFPFFVQPKNQMISFSRPSTKQRDTTQAAAVSSSVGRGFGRRARARALV